MIFAEFSPAPDSVLGRIIAEDNERFCEAIQEQLSRKYPHGILHYLKCATITPEEIQHIENERQRAADLATMLEKP